MDTFELSSWALIGGMDDHLLEAGSRWWWGVQRGPPLLGGLSGSTNQRHGWSLVREADRGQVSLITLRDEVIRQFRFHDPSKNLPFYKRGEQSCGNEGHCSMMRGGLRFEWRGWRCGSSCRPLLGVASGVISW